MSNEISGQQMLPNVVRENLFQDGPYLLAAFLCERVIEEKDGVKSIVRITDRITITAAGDNVPAQMQSFVCQTNMFISFKPGLRPAKYELKIDLVKPSGERAGGPAISLDLNRPPATGNDAIVKIGLQIEQEGVYWFEIYLNSMLVTKVPLQVIYLIQTIGKSDQNSGIPVM